MSKDDRRKKRPTFEGAVDTFMAAVPWTQRRTVIIYLREHGGRQYVRLRTFNRHQVKGCWYPAPRFYMVPIESAELLGKAIIAAAKGRSFGPEPEWWADFEKQYAGLARRQTDGKAPDCSTPSVGTPTD